MSFGRPHALYIIATGRRLRTQGLDEPSIDPKATAAELERELAGGKPAPSWTPPPLPDVVMPDLSSAFGAPAKRPEVMPGSYASPARTGPPYVRDEPEDIVICECGAAVSWAVYMDHHGTRPRDPDPPEGSGCVECECGEIVLDPGWLPYHRNGRNHRNRMSRKRAIAEIWRRP